MTMSARSGIQRSVQRSARIRRNILILSAVAWVVLLVSPGSTMLPAHHALAEGESSQVSWQSPVPEQTSTVAHTHQTDHAPTDSGVSQASSSLLLTMYSFTSLLANWVVMLVAMMSLTLIPPICHILDRTFKRRHARSVTLFVIGYAAVWLAAGAVLIATAAVLGRLMPQSYLPVVAVAIAAFIWQCSPLKQRCLNRGHNHRALAAFGRSADVDVLCFGFTHGVWCAGSCCELKLLAMLVTYGHVAVMALVTVVMFGERLEAPQPLRWRIRPRGTLIRMLVAQTQIQLYRALPRKLC